MHEVIKELKSALELQHAIQGTLIPLGSAEETSAVSKEAHDTTTVIPTPDVTPEAPAEINAAVETAEPNQPPVELHEPTAESVSDDTMPNTDLFGNVIDPASDTSLSPYTRVASLIPEGSPLHSMQTLEEVASYVANTVLIPLDEQRLNPVFGVGNPNSDLLVIGEAPGADEDRQGEPFVGRAGQLLNKIMAAINFERKDIYIANILKSRPPNNRDPQPNEVQAHIPVLYKQISLIQPKIILCVGKTAGNNLLQRNGSLASLRGKFNDFYGIPVMVTYHPAALLRNPQWKRPTWEDVQLLRSKYDELVA